MTDVLAGYALGAAWVSLVIALAIVLGPRFGRGAGEGGTARRIGGSNGQPKPSAVGEEAAV
jgi:hypothetical protein